MDREWRARVQEFVDWAVATGIDAGRIAHYRRFGADLVSRAGGGRVTESHILQLHDALEGTAEAEALLPAVEEVGDAMLRFQDHLRSLGRPVGARPLTPVPVAPLGTPPSTQAQEEPEPTSPPRSVGANAPRRPRPPEEPAPPAESPSPEPLPPLKPPRRPSSADPTGDDDVVSFTPVEPAPRAPSPTPTKPVEEPPRASPTPTRPTEEPARPRRTLAPTQPPARKAAGSPFRCPKCQVMVAPTDAGVCPKCGAHAPHVLAEPPPPIARSGGVTGRRVLLVLAGVAVLLFALTRTIPLLTERDPPGTRRVAGEHRSEHLGLAWTFPKGWRQILEQDAAYAHLPSVPYYGVDDVLGFDPKALEIYNLSELRLSSFYRGKPTPEHDTGLIVGLGVAAGPPGWKAGVEDTDGFLHFGASQLGKALPVAGLFHAPKCGVVQLEVRTGRCLTALDPGYLVSYFWVVPDTATYGIAILFVRKGGPEDAMTLGDSIVATIARL